MVVLVEGFGPQASGALREMLGGKPPKIKEGKKDPARTQSLDTEPLCLSYFVGSLAAAALPTDTALQPFALTYPSHIGDVGSAHPTETSALTWTDADGTQTTLKLQDFTDIGAIDESNDQGVKS